MVQKSNQEILAGPKTQIRSYKLGSGLKSGNTSWAQDSKQEILAGLRAQIRKYYLGS